jgi:hypothetical protein
VKCVFSKILAMMAVLVACVLIGVACTKREPHQNGIYKVRIPVDDGTGHYHFITAELRSVKDIHAMSGTVANLKIGGHVTHEVDDLKAKDWKVIDTKANDQTTPSAHFATVGDVLIPTDYTSLMLATVMYHMEGIKSFFDGIKGNEKLDFPFTVILNPNHIFTDKKYETYPITNNAAYLSSLDLFVFHPYHREELPMGFNGGIVGHEYTHRVFHGQTRNVLTDFLSKNINATILLDDTNVPAGSDIPPESSDSHSEANSESNIEVSPQELSKANVLMASALNEGLADYYAYEYTGNSAWMLPSAQKNQSRDVKVEKYVKDSKVKQLQLILEHNVYEDNPRRRIEQHDIGTVFATFFYKLSLIWGHERTKVAVLNFMPRFAEEFVKVRKKDFMSFGDIIDVFFHDEKPSKEVCDEIFSMFGGELRPTNFFPCISTDAGPGREDH